jgi:hypothetical protein
MAFVYFRYVFSAYLDESSEVRIAQRPRHGLQDAAVTLGELAEEVKGALQAAGTEQAVGQDLGQQVAQHAGLGDEDLLLGRAAAQKGLDAARQPEAVDRVGLLLPQHGHDLGQQSLRHVIGPGEGGGGGACGVPGAEELPLLGREHEVLGGVVLAVAVAEVVHQAKELHAQGGLGVAFAPGPVDPLQGVGTLLFQDFEREEGGRRGEGRVSVEEFREIRKGAQKLRSQGSYIY